MDPNPFQPSSSRPPTRASPARRALAGVVFIVATILLTYFDLSFLRPWDHAEDLGPIWVMIAVVFEFGLAILATTIAYVHETPLTARELVAEILAEIRTLEELVEDP